MPMAVSDRSWPIWRQRETGGWRQSACQRRKIAARPAYAGLSQPCGQGPSPGAVDAQDTLVLGKFLRDVAKLNLDRHNFRIFGPDETLSNLLGAVFEVTPRQWTPVLWQMMNSSPPPDAFWTRCSASTSARVGWRLSANRTARAVQQLRSLHPHRRLDVQPAC